VGLKNLLLELIKHSSRMVRTHGQGSEQACIEHTWSAQPQSREVHSQAHTSAPFGSFFAAGAGLAFFLGFSSSSSSSCVFQQPNMQSVKVAFYFCSHSATGAGLLLRLNLSLPLFLVIRHPNTVCSEISRGLHSDFGSAVLENLLA